MKLLFSITLCLLSYFAQAQTPNPYAGNTMQGGNVLFDCSHKTGPYTRMWNKQYGLSYPDTVSSKTNNCLRAMLTYESKVNIRAAAKEVFSPARAAELAQEKLIRLHFTITPQGNLAYVTYAFHMGTKVTPAEFGALENALRAKTFPLENGYLCPQVAYMGAQYTIVFSKLYP